MILDYNRYEVNRGQVFHFKNSLVPFVNISTEDDDLFLDIDELEAYTLNEILLSDDYEFYEKEDDEDFLGVESFGRIRWVSDN